MFAKLKLYINFVLKIIYMSIEEYVKSFGYKMSDLTPEDIKKVRKEVEDINKGYEILDGHLLSKGVIL